jgi:hypothetical protein
MSDAVDARTVAVTSCERAKATTSLGQQSLLAEDVDGGKLGRDEIRPGFSEPCVWPLSTTPSRPAPPGRRVAAGAEGLRPTGTALAR